MSVKRNVTVPLGNSSIATTSDRTRPLAQRSKLLQPTELVEAPHRVGVHSCALGHLSVLTPFSAPVQRSGRGGVEPFAARGLCRGGDSRPGCGPQLPDSLLASWNK